MVAVEAIQCAPARSKGNSCGYLTWSLWWRAPVMEALGKQEDSEFQVNLGYTGKHCLKNSLRMPQIWEMGDLDPV